MNTLLLIAPPVAIVPPSKRIKVLMNDTSPTGETVADNNRMTILVWLPDEPIKPANTANILFAMLPSVPILADSLLAVLFVIDPVVPINPDSETRMERITSKMPEVATEPERAFLACLTIADAGVIIAVIVVAARLTTVPPVAIEPLSTLTKTRTADTVADEAIEPSNDLYACLITVPPVATVPLSERVKLIVLDNAPLVAIVAARLRHVCLMTVLLVVTVPLNERRNVFSADTVPLIAIEPLRLLAKSFMTVPLAEIELCSAR